MKNDEWSDARQHAIKAAELDPVCPTVLFRAATCCLEMKDFIQAHTFYERAVHLLPTFERYPYLSELSRLKEKSDDKKANKTRADPFSVLPLETVIAVMRCGMNGDANFVLRCSWVSRRWREVLNHSCPELWKTWTVSHKETQSKYWDAKRAAWMERAGSRFDCLTLKDFSIGAANKISGKIRQYANGVKRFEAQVRNSAVLNQLVKNINKDYGFAFGIQDLRISGDRRGARSLGSSGYTSSPKQDLTCGIRMRVDDLHTIELTDIGFLTDSSVYRRRNVFRLPLIQRQNSRKVDEPMFKKYPALKRLVLDGCVFDNAHAVTLTEYNKPRSVPKYQADIVHTTLRGAPALEHLEVTILRSERMSSEADVGVRMEALKTAIVPPPSLWHINFSAPNLESIAFKLSSFDYERIAWAPIVTEQLPMIPTIEESPISETLLSKLKSVEFVCDRYDDIFRLEQWLPRLSGITTLTVHSVARSPYPPSNANTVDEDCNVAHGVIQSLNNNPEWCPTLANLRLEGCFTPSNLLLEYVESRRNMAGSATLKRLELKKCSALSAQAQAELKQKVPECIIVSGLGAASAVMRAPSSESDVVVGQSIRDLSPEV